ncbi:MAG: DUF1844 domain-containing protein [Planctomycetota bacterium]
MSDDAPRIQIDDDWKSQAAREKEQLADNVEQQDVGHGIPKADFLGLVQLLAMQAVIGLGGFAGPGGQEIPPNLDAAKHHIDLLDVLEKKTANNLDPTEKVTLETTLHQLRMAYVETMRAMTQGGPM